MERKLTDEERRELEIVSLAYELQDEYCDEPIEGNELLDEYYQNDPEAQSVLEECRQALEKEDVAYLAEKSPNPYERAFYRMRSLLPFV